MPMLKKCFKCWFSHPKRKAAFSVNLKRLLVSSADQCHSRLTLLPASLEPTASHSDLQGQRLWIRTRIFTIQPWIWNICTWHLSTPSSGAFSNCVYPQSFKQSWKLAQNTLPSLPRMRPSGPPVLVCIRVSARIQRHCKHGGVTGGWVALELLALFYSPCLYTTCFIDGNRIGRDPPGVLSWNAFLPDPSAPLQALWRWPFVTPRSPTVWVEVVVAIKTSGTNRLTSAFFVAHLQNSPWPGIQTPTNSNLIEAFQSILLSPLSLRSSLLHSPSPCNLKSCSNTVQLL